MATFIRVNLSKSGEPPWGIPIECAAGAAARDLFFDRQVARSARIRDPVRLRVRRRRVLGERRRAWRDTRVLPPGATPRGKRWSRM